MLRSDWDSQIPAFGPGMLPFFTRPSPSRSDGWGLGTTLNDNRCRDVYILVSVLCCTAIIMHPCFTPPVIYLFAILILLQCFQVKRFFCGQNNINNNYQDTKKLLFQLFVCSDLSPYIANGEAIQLWTVLCNFSQILNKSSPISGRVETSNLEL